MNSLDFSPDGTLLVSAGEDATIKLWNVQTGTCLVTLTDHTRPVNSLAFSRDGQFLVSGSDDATVKIWKIGEALKPQM